MEVVARYKQADVAWKVGRIMLKYRPIAPKPASASSGGAGAGAGAIEASRTTIGKRKSCAKGRKRGRKSTRREECSIITTLPLMPETPERKEEPAPAQTTSSDAASPTASFEGHVPPAPPCLPDAPAWQVVAPTPVRPVGSWVTVEKVTDTWRSGEPVVWDDEAVKRILERDACPAFLSDELEAVTWTNSAYKNMVVGTTTTATTAEVVEEEEEEEEVRVALVSRSGMVPEGVTCFTCRVRVRYACRSRRGTMSMAAPCDVWRLADGKLVWRLDVKAALSLGLGC